MWPCGFTRICFRVKTLNFVVRSFHLCAAMPRGTKRKSEDSETAVKGGNSSDPEQPPPAKKGRGRSKKATEETDGAMMSKKKEGNSSKGAANSNKTDWSSVQWSELGKTKDGRPWAKKISSWNVNGIRAWLKNGGHTYISHEDPDIFCVQETKCQEDEMPMDQLHVPGYHIYWHSAEKKGYSGVGLYSKEKPISVTKGIGIEKYDCEGRLITAEYEDFFFLTAYVPNAGEGLKRLDFKQSWDVDLRDYMKKLDAQKPVILCGDLNVAHKEIDLKNPKTNTGTAGFTPQEREDFTLLLKEGFVDTFRHFYPDLAHAYTYWSYRFNARQKNTGWRLDYFVVSERFLPHVCDCVIRKEVYGSDHCPLVLSLASPNGDPAPSGASSDPPPSSDTPTNNSDPPAATEDSADKDK